MGLKKLKEKPHFILIILSHAILTLCPDNIQAQAAPKDRNWFIGTTVGVVRTKRIPGNHFNDALLKGIQGGWSGRRFMFYMRSSRYISLRVTELSIEKLTAKSLAYSVYYKPFVSKYTTIALGGGFSWDAVGIDRLPPPPPGNQFVLMPGLGYQLGSLIEFIPHPLNFAIRLEASFNRFSVYHGGPFSGFVQFRSHLLSISLNYLPPYF